MAAKGRSYLVPGTLTRAEDSWCDQCMKPTVWSGPVSLLSDRGVTLWGSIVGCFEHKEYTWKDLRGKTVKVTRTPDKE